MRKQNEAGLVGLLVAGASILGIGAIPANAAASDCGSSRFCVWTNTEYTGTLWQYNTTTASGPNMGISSLINRKSYSIRVWDAENFSGNSKAFEAAHATNNLGTYNRYGPLTWNDAIRSFQQGA